MIELTTGVVFLMSSLYGSGQDVNHNQALPEQSAETVQQATTTVVASSFTDTNDPKAMEAYLRKEFADSPILVDVARCESNFRHFDRNGKILRGAVDSADLGLMQINERYWGPTAKNMGIDLYTVEGNIAYAKHLYSEQGVRPWLPSAKCWSAGSGNVVAAKVSSESVSIKTD